MSKNGKNEKFIPYVLWQGTLDGHGNYRVVRTSSRALVVEENTGLDALGNPAWFSAPNYDREKVLEWALTRVFDDLSSRAIPAGR